jgi:hypothetical protein
MAEADSRFAWLESSMVLRAFLKKKDALSSQLLRRQRYKGHSLRAKCENLPEKQNKTNKAKGLGAWLKL